MDKLQQLIMLLTDYIKRKWYGKVTLSMEAGNIVNVKAEENIKL